MSLFLPRALPCFATLALILALPGRAQGLACEKYRLANGMTVILHEDHSLPLSAVNIWYGVGAKDEAPGRSGFAHLFEHLMFMGTERVPGSQFDQLMEAGGGSNNASTAQDRTNYHSSGPASLLPLLLWLEADRMEALGRTMNQEKLDLQRDVVRNERRQSYENQPYGVGDLVVQSESYPKGHPYHESVIGSHEDLQAATVADVQQFFASFYVPSNASLVVGGDFDPKEIKPLIEQWFGTLPSQDVPPHATAEPVQFASLRRFVVSDKVEAPRLTLAWHSPALWAAGDAEMDLVSGVLAQGDSSRLQRRLVHEQRVATSVVAYQQSQRLGSLFVIEVTGTPESSPDSLRASIDAELALLREKGPTAEELERVRNTIQRGALERLQTLDLRIDQINAYESLLGEPDSLKADLARYDAATTQGVRNWATKVLLPEQRLEVVVLPQDPRGEKPQSGAPRPFTFPAPATFTLANGMTVHLWERPELPLVGLRLVVPGGQAQDAKGKAGLSSLMLDLLDEGSGSHDARQFAAALDLLGASFDTSAGNSALVLSLSSLAKNFPQALSLVNEAVSTPRFEAKDVQRVRELRVNQLREELNEPASIAEQVGQRLLLGADHPYGSPATPETVASLKDEDIRATWRSSLRPERATLLVAGRITRTELEPLLAATFGAFRQEGAAAPLSATTASAARPFSVVIVDRPGAVQTVVRFVMPGPDVGTPDRMALTMLNTLFGSAFTSRLNQNLREKHGYTYGARSQFTMTPGTGWVTATASVRADVTGASVAEFLAEFQRIGKGDVTDHEREKSSATTRNRLVDGSSGIDGALGQAAAAVIAGRPLASRDTDLASLNEVSTRQLNELASKWLVPEQGVLVLVGDQAEITKQLQGLKLPSPILLDAMGNPLP